MNEILIVTLGIITVLSLGAMVTVTLMILKNANNGSSETRELLDSVLVHFKTNTPMEKAAYDSAKMRDGILLEDLQRQLQNSEKPLGPEVFAPDSYVTANDGRSYRKDDIEPIFELSPEEN